MGAYFMGMAGCLVIIASHLILSYSRKTERLAAKRPALPVAIAAAGHSCAASREDLVDPRVAKIISDIPQRRTRRSLRIASAIP